MASKKYLADYTIKYEEGRNGKLRAIAVYTGKNYVFTEPMPVVRKAKKLITLLVASVWCAYIIPLSYQSAAAKTNYVIFPHVVVFLPLLSMSLAVYDLWTAKIPLTREKSDHFSTRVPISSLLMVIFSGLASAGCIVSCLIGQIEFAAGEIAFALCDAIMFLASYFLFRFRKRIATREISDT